MNEKSYTELMKIGAMERQKQKESLALDRYIDTLLSEILLKEEKKKLLQRIDDALDRGDKDTFLHLSDQYKKLTEQFGN